MSVKIGTASYEKQGAKKNIFSLKDGENVYRILPPMFDLADKKTWAVFYRVEYGYKDTSGRMKPFLDVRVVNRQNKMVEVESAAHVRREQLKAKLNELKINGADEATLNKVKEMVDNFNQDSKWHMNVVDKNGQIGVLKIPHRAKQALDETIKKLMSEGVDPTSVNNGRFFVFSRSGRGLDTLHQVSVLKEKIKVDGIGMVEKDVIHKLDDGILSRLSTEATELDKMYLRLSPEEVESVVKGGPSALTAILEARKNNTSTSTVEDDEPDMDTAVTQQPALKKQTSNLSEVLPSNTTSATAKTATLTVDENLLNVSKQETATATVAATVTTTTATAGGVDISKMSDEDFMSFLGSR
jgi:hypothetical protein